MHDPDHRRRPLQTVPNPEPAMDYVVALRAVLSPANGGQDDGAGPTLTVRCIPDRHILPEPAWAAYATGLDITAFATLEQLAAAAFSDLANQLVPRWLELTATAAITTAPPRSGHAVRLEEAQPGWTNPPLLARLHATPAQEMLS